MANVAELFGSSCVSCVSAVSALLVNDAPVHTTRGWMVGNERLSVPHDSRLSEFEWDKSLGGYIASFTWQDSPMQSC